MVRMIEKWVEGVFIIGALLYAWQAYERGVVAVLNEMLAWMMAWLWGCGGMSQLPDF